MNSLKSYGFDRFHDVLDTLERCKESKMMGIGVYGFDILNQCNISDIHFEASERSDEDYGNLEIRLAYSQRVITDKGVEWIPNTRNLFLLSSNGDTEWTYNMKQKLWDGDYPYAVAIDEVTGEIFFVHIALDGFILKLFGREEGIYKVLTETQVLSAKEPYQIKIKPEAMFAYIDGTEGTNHLKDSIFIELNCSGKPICINRLEADL